MNDIAKTNTQMKLAIAMQREDLTQVEAAEALELPVLYIGCIRNKNRWDKVPDKRWEQVLRWVNSGQSLKEYAKKHGRVMPEKYEEKKEEAAKEVTIAEIQEAKQETEEHENDAMLESNERLKESIMRDIDLKRAEAKEIREFGKEPMVPLHFYKDEINRAYGRIRELTKELESFKRPSELTADSASQKFAIDLEINILINGKKFSLS
jgi:hypothetical protein